MRILRSLASSVRPVRAGRGKDVRNYKPAGVRQKLEYVQIGSRVTVAVELASDVRVHQLWARTSDDEWFPVAPFSAPTAVRGVDDRHTVSSEASFCLDDPLMAERLQIVRGGAGRAHLFLEVAGAAQALVKGRQSIDYLPSPDEAASSQQGEMRAYIALGRFSHTITRGLAPVIVEGQRVQTHTTRHGNLVLTVDVPLSPYASVHIDEARIVANEFVFRGRIYTRHTVLDDAVLSLEGRETGKTLSAPLSLKLNEEYSASHWGHGRYDVSAALPLTEFIDQGGADDLFDARVLAAPVNAEERVRARVGRSRYLVRRRVNEGWAEKNETAVLVSPYYTFKAKKLSVRVEVFDASVLRRLRQRIRAREVIGRPRNSAPVWLIGEQRFKAQDNGLAFFKYLSTNHPEIDAYYVLDADSPDRANLVGYENIVEFRSAEHVDLLFRADRVVGSHHPDYLYPSRSRMLLNAVDPVKVFLQHGVYGVRRIEGLYGRRAADFDTDLFIVSSERERRNTITDLGYKPEEVAITGLPRFDTLFDGMDVTEEGTILVMPSWREWLQNTEDFLTSEYFERWNALLNSPRLNRLLDENAAEVVLHLHPNMRMFAHYFTSSRVRLVEQGEESVQHLLKTCSLLITDYSSVGFDVSFLDKPVLYYQFDRVRFLKGGTHIDVDAELPGPIISNEDGLIDELEAAMTRRYEIEPVFARRAVDHIDHRDMENCARVFDAVTAARHRTDTISDRYAETFQALVRAARRRKQYFPVMRRLYKVFQNLPIQDDLIVFEAGLGKQMNDSPKALYDELVHRGDPRTKVWVHNGRPILSDEHTRVVARLSPEYYWYLARARYWITNQNMPHYLRRRPGCTYVQTWHGTPLKRMLHDLEEVHGRNEGYTDRVSNAIAQWTHLLSPSPFATQAFASAFRHDATVIEEGYPRNDELSRPDRNAVGERVRRRLGIRPGARTVLYAPTFRDNEPAGQGRFRFRPPFTLAEMVDALGPEAVLLVRLHVVIAGKAVIPEGYEGRIIDVTRYPDLNELFLASDVLVTDYSSLFFDYALLERPIVFFAYDLEEYRDELRGFYLDYPEDLPGPVVADLETLGQAVRDDLAVDARDRAAFLARFAPWDDGRAAKRVVDSLL